jgi:hypothetical protein
MTYTYKKPDGFQTYLTGKELCEFFPARKIYRHAYVELFITNKTIIMHYYARWYIKAFNVIAYPVLLFIVGFSNIKTLNKEFYNMFHQRETGSFSGDEVPNFNNDTKSDYAKVLHYLIKKKRITVDDI